MSTGLLAYTLLHVAISLVGIGAGLAVMYGWLKSCECARTTAVFLAATVLTSLTGFGFPFEKLTPAHAFGVISLVLLGVAVYARYGARLAGGWRATYVITAGVAQYLNVFVLIVQSFLKVPALAALAPTQSEPPFAVAQGITLLSFVVAIALAVRRFRPLTNTGTAK